MSEERLPERVGCYRVTRVLIVDDEPSIRQVVSEVLEAQGFYVETAIHGQDALARMRANEPDVIVTDLMMPVMDGWAFIRQCRRVSIRELIPIVVMSAHYQLAESVLDCDVQGFVGKPFEIDVLVSAVERLAPPR